MLRIGLLMLSWVISWVVSSQPTRSYFLTVIRFISVFNEPLELALHQSFRKIKSRLSVDHLKWNIGFNSDDRQSM